MRITGINLGFLLGLILWNSDSLAQAGLYDGRTAAPVEISTALSSIPKGAVVIVSEVHGYEPHQSNQKAVIEWLGQHGHAVDSALEFLQRRFANEVDRYLTGQFTDEEFQKRVEWGGRDAFALYKPLIWTPLRFGGRSWAINADRRLTNKVSQVGLSALDEAERRELPPQFELGNKDYFEKFTEVMKDHVKKEKLPDYFAAQSIWDDTMAYEIQKLKEAAPERTLVVIVGDFHNAYELGLPDRLYLRGVENIYTISQIAKFDQTWDQLIPEIKPHPRWGPRADWIWVTP